VNDFRQNLGDKVSGGISSSRAGRSYAMKQIEVLAVWQNDDWLVITVIVKYF
jgi:hypothetical protein